MTDKPAGQREHRTGGLQHGRRHACRAEQAMTKEAKAPTAEQIEWARDVYASFDAVKRDGGFIDTADIINVIAIRLAEREAAIPSEGPVARKAAGDSDTPITHEQAMQSAQRLINSFFKRPDSEKARAGIPARPGYDDDLVICQYIREQQARAPLWVTP